MYSHRNVSDRDVCALIAETIADHAIVLGTCRSLELGYGIPMITHMRAASSLKSIPSDT